MTAPETFYLVTTTFPEMGWANAGDVTAIRDRAYDDYAEVRSEGRTAQVWMIETRADGRRAISEITEEMENELQRICAQRDLDIPEVA
ncbi:MAG: hypothetical protein AAFQ38_14975 [Pseudomonadota bacterium]